MKIKILCFIVFLSSYSHAIALPIFSENQAIKLASGVVLYPDSEDSKLLYYFPGIGELIKNEKKIPLFGFTYWGLRKSASTGEITMTPDAGAYLSLAAHLTFTPEQLSEVKSILGADGKIAVLPIKDSMIELKTTVSSQIPLGKFFDEFNIARKGGQADADISLNASLTGLGARTMMTAMKNPMFMKFDYCFQTLGLSPLFKGVVKLNWSQIYEKIKNTYAVGWFFSRAQVSITIQKMIRDGSLGIEISAAPESEAKYEEFIMKIASMLMDRMFKAELPSETANEDALKWSFYRVELDYGRSEIHENVTFTLNRRELVTHEQCIPINISDLKTHFNELVQSSDGVTI